MVTINDNEIIIRPSKIFFTLITFSHALLIFLIHLLDFHSYFTIILAAVTLGSYYYHSKVYFLRQSKKQVKRLEYKETEKKWLLTLGNNQQIYGRLKSNNYSSNIVLVLNFETQSDKFTDNTHKKNKPINVVAIVFNDSVSITAFRFLKRNIKYFK